MKTNPLVSVLQSDLKMVYAEIILLERYMKNNEVSWKDMAACFQKYIINIRAFLHFTFDGH